MMGIWYGFDVYSFTFGKSGQQIQASCCLCRTRYFIFPRLKSIAREMYGLGTQKLRHFPAYTRCLLLLMVQCRALCQLTSACFLVRLVQLSI